MTWKEKCKFRRKEHEKATESNEKIKYKKT